MRKWLCCLLAISLFLSGCTLNKPVSSAPVSSSVSIPAYVPPGPKTGIGTAYPDQEIGFQLEPPKKGDQIAVFHTNYGDIAIRLFPEAAPKAVENFETHIQDGYFDNAMFHRLVKDFMIQGGSSLGPDLGMSIWNKAFTDEFDQKLFHLQGAVSMATTGAENSNQAEFMICLAGTDQAETKAQAQQDVTNFAVQYAQYAPQYVDAYSQNIDTLGPLFGSLQNYLYANLYPPVLPQTVPDDVWALYAKYGGSIHLDGQFRGYGGNTIFGQVFQGLDVAQAMANTDVTANDSRPLTDVRLIKAEVVAYDPDTLKPTGVLTPPAETFTHNITSAYADKQVGFQMDKPAVGEDIAVLHTDKGDIKIRLFPDGAPKAVENFKGQIEKGNYNGTLFDFVSDDFVIKGGVPTDGTDAKDIWGGSFDGEYNAKLLNLRGAVSMSNSGAEGTNNSQFLINQTGPTNAMTKDDAQQSADQFNSEYDADREQAKTQYEQDTGTYNVTFDEYFAANMTLAPDPKLVPDDVWAEYAKVGGNIYLDGAWRNYGGDPVFGQVFEGLDVVDAIAQVPVDSNEKPTTDIKIISAEIVKYTG